MAMSPHCRVLIAQGALAITDSAEKGEGRTNEFCGSGVVSQVRRWPRYLGHTRISSGLKPAHLRAFFVGLKPALPLEELSSAGLWAGSRRWGVRDRGGWCWWPSQTPGARRVR